MLQSGGAGTEGFFLARQLAFKGSGCFSAFGKGGLTLGVQTAFFFFTSIYALLAMGSAFFTLYSKKIAFF